MAPLSPSELAAALRGPRQSLVIAGGIALLLCLALSAALISPDPTVGVVLVVALPCVWVLLRRPLLLYAVTLAQFSLIPCEGHLLGFFVPNMFQLLFPALMVSIVFDRLRRRAWGMLAVGSADVFLGAFVVLGYIGLFALPGERQWKFYTNQVVFPIGLFFASRWIEINRQQFVWVLRVALGAAVAMAVAMVIVPLIGWDPLWNLESGYQGFGALAEGPTGSIADAGGYTPLWVPFLLYAATLVPRGSPWWRAWGAWLGCVVVSLASLSIGERSPIMAVSSGLLLPMLSRAMRRYAVAGLAVIAALGALWVVAGPGGLVGVRLKEEDPMFRRRVYRQKAIDYIRSPEWNPWFGTGFARLQKVSVKTIPETRYVWYVKWREWRQAITVADRPIHCAPLNVYGQYGLLGLGCLAGVGASLVAAGAKAIRYARRRGQQPDIALFLAGGACALGVAAQSLYHNTDTVHQIASLCWAYAGLLAGHPDVFALPRPEAEEASEPPAEPGESRPSGDASARHVRGVVRR